MFNELAQNDINALMFIMYAHKLMVIIGVVLAVTCLKSLFVYLSNTENKDIYYGIFLIDGYCFFRFTCGMCAIKLIGLIYCLLSIKALPGSVVNSTITYGIYVIGLFIVSIFIQKQSDKIYDSCKEKLK